MHYRRGSSFIKFKERLEEIVSTPAPAARILLISWDFGVIDNMRRIMNQAAMDVDICSDARLVPAKLCKSKYDAVVIDFKDSEAAINLLATIRTMTSHRRAVILAILGTDNDVQSAFRAGANFVLERSLCARTVTRTLRAAYPLILREMRRYFRCPLSIPVYVTTEALSEFQVTAINISEGGMAVESMARLPAGSKLQVRLILPGTADPLNASAEVCWNDGTRRLGLRFSQLASPMLEQLQLWLFSRLQDSMSTETPLAEATAAQ
jgi:hypothetical protein